MSAIQDQKPTVNIVGRLEVQGRTLAIGQVCQNWLVLRDPFDIGPCAAKLIVSVKGVDRIRDIYLPHGISADREVIDFL
jgi:hypothetical protein